MAERATVLLVVSQLEVLQLVLLPKTVTRRALPGALRLLVALL